MRDPPDPNTLHELHDRLLGGDRLASEEFSRLLLPSLLEELTRRFHGVDEQLVSDGVIDAVFDYCTHPAHFDIARDVPLDRFLANAARRNVDNLLTSECRLKRRERKVASKKREANIALDPVARNIQQEELQQRNEHQAAMFAVLDDPTDKEILRLKLAGVRNNEDFARVLNITNLPVAQQRQEVKRHKDRIAQFLRQKGLLK